MAEIAYILLCHKDPDGIIRQVNCLTGAGDNVAIHFDARAGKASYQRLRQAFAGNRRVAFAARRVKCGWGEWTLVQATMNAARAAIEAFPSASHFYLISGDCLPIKSAAYLHDFLDLNDADFIEHVDFHEGGWIKTGLREDRLIYRHLFNERANKWLFYKSLDLQRRLGLARPVPPDLRIMIGSQWWCLRRRTLEALFDFCARRADIVRFFKTTWIPDETFFQTLVHHLVPAAQLRNRTPTFLAFTDYGMPVAFCDDHHDLLLAQDYLFARKISAGADSLRAQLLALYGDPGRRFQITSDGRKLFAFVTSRGREGRRFATRLWDRDAGVGQGRDLLIVVCKKWHVAKRLAARAAEAAGIPAVEYLFNEADARLPDLGGAERGTEKRRRHAGAFVHLLHEALGAHKLLLCLDPADFEILKDLAAGDAHVRVLEVACDFTDDYLIGHSRRIGLAGHAADAETLDRILPMVRLDVRHESDRLRAAGLPDFHRIRQSDAPDANAVPLAAFLGIAAPDARAIAETPYLFDD